MNSISVSFNRSQTDLKKQSIAEKKKAIEKAEESKEPKKTTTIYSSKDDKDSGNDDLTLYATLLLPFWESYSTVRPFIQQMLTSNDKRLKYNIALLLIRNNKLTRTAC